MRRAPRLRLLASRASVALFLMLSLTSRAHGYNLFGVGGSICPGGGQSGLVTVNRVTGVPTCVGPLSTPWSGDNTIYSGGLAYDPYTDRLYGLGCDSSVTSALFLINKNTGAISRIGYLGGSNPYSFCSGGLAFDWQTRKLFAVGNPGAPPHSQTTHLFEVDPNTGAATELGFNGPPGTYLGGLGCDPVTGVLYANGFYQWDQTSALFALNKGNGTATFIGYHGLSLGRQMNYCGLANDPASGTMYSMGSFSASQSGLYTVDKSSGAASLVAVMTQGIGVDGALAFVGTDVLGVPGVAPVPIGLHAWPSPARGPVSLSFALAQAARVSLTLHDVAGRRVATLIEGQLEAGSHSTGWNGQDAFEHAARAGVYLATLRMDGTVIGRTTVVLAR